MKVKRKGSTWLRVQREVVALLGMMPQRPSHFRPNCVNVWTPGQLNRATNRHAPKPSFGLSSGGLKRFIEGSRPRTEPRKHPKWPPGRWTASVIRQQPRKNANFASGDLSKDRKSSETSARNRVMIDQRWSRCSASGGQVIRQNENPARVRGSGRGLGNAPASLVSRVPLWERNTLALRGSRAAAPILFALCACRTVRCNPIADPQIHSRGLEITSDAPC